MRQEEERAGAYSEIRRGPTRWAAVAAVVRGRGRPRARRAAVEWRQPVLANRRPGAGRLGGVGALRGLDKGFDTRRGAAQGPTVRRQGSGVTDAYGIYLSPPLVREVADDARQEHEDNGQEHDDDST